MRTIARLFGKSPFLLFQSHMKKVSLCIKKLSKIFESLENSEKIESLVKELSKLEYEADQTKLDIRAHLPKSLFLPIDRYQLLELLSLQDSIANKAEDIGHLLALHTLDTDSLLYKNLHTLYLKNLEAFWNVRQIVKDFGDLLESSFGGIEAERVKALADKISHEEYEADKLKHKIMKEFFEIATKLSTPSFYLYVRLIEEINDISHISEKLAGRIRLILEVK